MSLHETESPIAFCSSGNLAPATARHRWHRGAGLAVASCFPSTPAARLPCREPSLRLRPLAETGAIVLPSVAEYSAQVEPRVTLLDALREHQGSPEQRRAAITASAAHRSSSWTVSIPALPWQSCTRAMSITTIEGLAIRRAASSRATSVHRARWIPMRLLHSGPDLLGGWTPQRSSRQIRRGHPPADERQHLPLRVLSEHR